MLPRYTIGPYCERIPLLPFLAICQCFERITPTQRTAAVTGMVECLALADLVAAAVEVAVDSGSSKSYEGEVV